MNSDQVQAELEFSRLMQVEYRPRIEGLMADGEIFDEPGLSAETLEPLLRGAFEAGRATADPGRPDLLDIMTIIELQAEPHANTAGGASWAQACAFCLGLLRGEEVIDQAGTRYPPAADPEARGGGRDEAASAQGRSPPNSPDKELGDTLAAEDRTSASTQGETKRPPAPCSGCKRFGTYHGEDTPRPSCMDCSRGHGDLYDPIDPTLSDAAPTPSTPSEELALTFDELKTAFLAYGWKSEYMQAAIVVARNIYESRAVRRSRSPQGGRSNKDLLELLDRMHGIYCNVYAYHHNLLDEYVAPLREVHKIEEELRAALCVRLQGEGIER